MQPSAWYNNDPSAKPTLFKLLAADGFTIDTYEEGDSPWTLAFDRTSPGLFLLPTWRYPSLVHYKLAVHMNPRTLSDKAMNIHVLGTPTCHITTEISVTICHSCKYLDLLTSCNHSKLLIWVATKLSTTSGQADHLHIPTHDNTHHTNWRTPRCSSTRCWTTASFILQIALTPHHCPYYQNLVARNIGYASILGN